MLVVVISYCAKLLIMADAAAYKALADPTRRRILKLLRDGDLPAGVIAEQFPISWPSVSRHLAILTAAGLVHPTRRGQQRVYSLTKPALVEIAAELASIAGIGRRRRRRTAPARAVARLRPRPSRAP